MSNFEDALRHPWYCTHLYLNKTTIALIADVIEWSRVTAKICEDEHGPVLMLRKAIAELDRHHFEKNGGDK